MSRFLVDTVVCDMDGTVLASRNFALTAIRNAFAILGSEYPDLPIPVDGTIVAQIGKPFHAFYKDLLPARFRDLEARLFELTQLGESRAIEGGQASLFPRVTETLVELRARGLNLALISNCSSNYLEKIEYAFQLSQYFHRLACVGDRPGQSKTDLLRSALASLKSHRAVMVGDRVHDREAARECGCFFVGCSYGYGGTGELAEHDALIGDFSELSGIVERSGERGDFSNSTPSKA